MAELLEMVMVVCFGASWPFNVVKSYRARTARGKSLWFLLLVLVGYVAGIAAKLINPDYMAQLSEKWYLLFFYILNFTMVFADLLLYLRNVRLDRLRAAQTDREA